MMGTRAPPPNCSELDLAENGWRKKNNSAVAKQELPKFENPYDFCIENPLHGKLWQIQKFQRFVGRVDVQFASTSYCKYNCSYRKNTGFLTSVLNFSPCPVCSKNDSCQRYQQHDELPVDQASRNSIPEGLVLELIDAWVRKKKCEGFKVFLIIDVFAGYNSISKAADLHNKTSNDNVVVYTNDIVRTRGGNMDLDMRVFELNDILVFALRKLFLEMPYDLADIKGDVKQFLLNESIAVLFHLSTPCETYSVAGGASHRLRGSAEPQSRLAVAHDDMNSKIVDWIFLNILDE